MNFLRRYSRIHPVEAGVVCIFVLIFLAIIVMCILQIYGLYFKKLRERNEKGLSRLFERVVTENAILPEALFLPYIHNISIVVMTIRAFNAKFKGKAWEETKEILITKLLQQKLLKYLKSKRWVKRSWALQALALYPQAIDTKKVLPLLQDKTPIVRLSAARCASLVSKEESMEALVAVMSLEESYARYPFRDLLVAQGNEVYALLQKQLQKTKDVKKRIAILEVISQRIGFINYELIKDDLKSKNEELRWWAVRSLEDCPEENRNSLLLEISQNETPQIRAIAIWCLGNIGYRKALPKLREYLFEEHHIIRLKSALAIRKIEDEGDKILKGIREEEGKTAFDVANYVLSLPEEALNIGDLKWYRN